MRYRPAISTSKSAGIPRRYWGTYLDEIIPVNDEQTQLKNKLLELENGEWWSVSVLGTVGNGKTMLACGLVEYHNFFHPFTAFYTTQEQLADDVKDSYSCGRSEADVIDRYMRCQLLVLDELTVRNWTDHTKNLVQKILSTRHANKLRTVLIGNLDAETFKGMFDGHIVSRLREGETQLMVAGDMRTHGTF